MNLLSVTRSLSFVSLLAGSLALGACNNGAQRSLRPPRAGVQRDRANRAYFELRELSAVYCQQEGHDAARTEQGARDRLSLSAQEQGYSGVRDVACERGSADCATGYTCRGIAVRYVIQAADGTVPEVRRGPCDPVCEGTATCQDGQCVAQCPTPCPGGRVCVQDSTCVGFD
ncbi:MAG: hypothetical protein Q8Q09_04020 [Deltaproteobacteria bacterium]|nr:hypothetical protein [Deltaproteobacteria bacterium]